MTITDPDLEARLAAATGQAPPERWGQGTEIRATADAEEPSRLGVVDWTEVFAGVSHEDPILDGLIFRGRWTALVAAAKTGKSTFQIALGHGLATGQDPLTGAKREPVKVLLLDAEMGRVDVVERLKDDFLAEPAHLASFHYVDLVPVLNTPEGAAEVLAYVDQEQIDIVIIDGLNGAVHGPENDDPTWRPFFTATVAPLKARSVAVVTCDNLGKDKTLGPRGSSVKLDKPDAVIQLERTDGGLKLKTTHRRTAAYPSATELAVTGIDSPGEPVTYRYSTSSWPAGTAAKADELDRADVPLNASRRAAREALQAAGITPGKNDVLAAAIRYRNTADYQARNTPDGPGTTPRTTLQAPDEDQ